MNKILTNNEINQFKNDGAIFLKGKFDIEWIEKLKKGIKKDVENVDPEAGLGNSNGQGLERFGVPATRSLGFSINVKF